MTSPDDRKREAEIRIEAAYGGMPNDTLALLRLLDESRSQCETLAQQLEYEADLSAKHLPNALKLLARAEAAESRCGALTTALRRLGSMEALAVSRMIARERDEELIARINFANAALAASGAETTGREASLNVWEVKPGSLMHDGGHKLGWYWDRPDDDEPHGPFDSAAAARRDAAQGIDSPKDRDERSEGSTAKPREPDPTNGRDAPVLPADSPATDRSTPR